MLIKILSIIAFLPMMHVIKKVIKRRDLTVIDILLTFQTLYMSIIPFWGDQNEISYPILRTEPIVPVYICVVYVCFASCLILADSWLSRKYTEISHPYHITSFIRNWIVRCRFSNKILILLLVLFVFQCYVTMNNYTRSLEIGIGSMEQIRAASQASQTPFQMWISGGLHVFRLYAVFMITALFFQYKKGMIIFRQKWLLYLLVLCEVLWHLQISRTYVLESVCLVILMVYAMRKDHLRVIDVGKYMMICGLVIFMLFPLIQGFRYARRVMVGSGVTADNYVDFFSEAWTILKHSDMKLDKLDNSASRQWNVYQIIGLSYNCEYEGNGTLTAYAIMHGIPKAVFPAKPRYGSQTIIERATGINDDLGDSYLMNGVMENRFLAPIWATLFYLMDFLALFFLFKMLGKYLPSVLCLPLYINHLFRNVDKIEVTFDGFIPSIYGFILWYMVFYFALKGFEKLNVRFLQRGF